MDTVPNGPLPPSHFSAELVRQNRPAMADFEAWRFQPGMLFGAATKWWGDGGPRPVRHEGLDLCLYTDRGHRTCRLDVDTRIPALYPGTVTAVLDDFIGRSLCLMHTWGEGDDQHRFLTLYGHLRLTSNRQIGQTVKAGEIIGRLASPRASRSGISPHLHLSVAHLQGSIDPAGLNWQSIPDHPLLTLQDPLALIDGPFRIDAADPTAAAHFPAGSRRTSTGGPHGR